MHAFMCFEVAAFNSQLDLRYSKKASVGSKHVPTFTLAINLNLIQVHLPLAEAVSGVTGVLVAVVCWSACRGVLLVVSVGCHQRLTCRRQCWR